jgi:N-acetylneuraminic acid mutarotase
VNVRGWLLLLVACDAPPSHHEPIDSPWREVAPIGGGARLEAAVVAAGGEVYVLGGFDGELELSRSVWAYAPESDTWRRRADLPAPRTHMNVAGDEGAIYVLGGLVGRDFTAGGESWAYDVGDDTWRTLAAMPTPRGSAATAWLGTKIVVAGGSDGDQTLATVELYDPVSDRWSDGAALPSPRSHVLGVSLGEQILAVGGLAGVPPIDEVLAFDGTAWRERARLPVRRGGCAGGLLGGKVICTGGETDVAVVRDTVAYDPSTDVWTTLAPMRTPRAGTHGAVVGDILVVPGGAAVLDYVPLAVTEVLGADDLR